MDNFRQGRDPQDVPVVPGYVVGRELGRGGSATVWLVADELTRRDFALKCFVPGPEQPDPAAVEESVRREIRILSALDHQHLVKAHDVVRLAGAAGGRLGLVMDYASGGSLGQLVASRGKLSIGETVTVLTPIAQVLGYLHGKGFTHSDVSPGNVLFSGHGKPLLTDVGVARMAGDAAGVSEHGTEGFVDPAPVDAVRAGLQPERDVFAAAALGWYCLTGKAPQLAADRPPLSLLNPDVPAELAAALEAGLCEDRRLRPTAAELATAVYRSAAAAPLDLSGSVHPTVIPELLTRRHTPRPSGGRIRQRIGAWGRRLSTMRWASGVETPGAVLATAGPPEAEAIPVRRQSHRAVASRSRRRLWLAASVLALAGAAVACVWWMMGPQRSTGPDQIPRAASTERAPVSDNDASEGIVPDNILGQLRSADPQEALHGLAWLRSAAFRSGRLELLDQVNVLDSPAASADSRISSRLQESGHVLAGFTTTLTGAETLPGATAARAVVSARSTTSAYEEKDASGTVVAAGPAGAEQRLVLVLVPVDGTWRISEILPAG